MEIVSNNYLPGDPHLVEKIVYDLKSQGIFDQFRKECFADVDTKPAYQNLRQRVEGSVSGFLKDQSWRPDMNKNQVREMLRKKLNESGFLEPGVERIVDQVVNPKINTVFLPQVEEVFYSHLGIKKPSKGESSKTEVSTSDLLPTDLEAVSPESEPIEKKEEKISDISAELEETKTEEDESPAFEPLDEAPAYIPQEENSVDSHMSGFSGLASHESNLSNKIEQDSQMSRNSSDSRLSIVTSDDNSKMEVCEDSQSKSVKSTDSNHKSDKDKHRSSDKHKSRSDSRSDRERKSSKDSKSRHGSSKDKSRDRKDSHSSSKDHRSHKNEKDKTKEHRSSSKPSSSKDKKEHKSSLSSHKYRSTSSDSKSKSSSSHKHSSSSSHSDKHKRDKDKDKKKDSRSKDDHYSSRDKKNERRSTDRDSSDGHSSSFHGTSAENKPTTNQKPSAPANSGESGNSDHSEHSTKTPINVSGMINKDSELVFSQKIKLLKPKCASNIQEAIRLRKIRKQLAKLEKQNQLGLASVDVETSVLTKSSINLSNLVEKPVSNIELSEEMEVVPSPLQNTVISQDNWDAMEAKLRQEISQEFETYGLDDSGEERIEIVKTAGTEVKKQELEVKAEIEKPEGVVEIEEPEVQVEERKAEVAVEIEEPEVKSEEYKENVELEMKEPELKTIVKPSEPDCKYFDKIDFSQIKFVQFVSEYAKKVETSKKRLKRDSNDFKNNNIKKNENIIPEKRRKTVKKIDDKFSLPLSPAESDKSAGKKEETVTPLRTKRNNISKVNSQRYSSEDLYKPRPTFASSRRRGSKNLDK